MAWWVLGAYALFGALCFGWRTVLQYRRTGSTGFRGLSGRLGSLEWIGGALFIVAIVCAPLSPVLALMGTLATIRLDGVLLRSLGAALYAIGLCGTLWAQLAMEESWRIGVDPSERTRLILRGPFLYVRNPIYSSMVVCVAGLVLLLPNALGCVALVTLVWGLELHVRYVEEPYLRSAHGEAYRRYCAVVGRFLPAVGRMSG